MRYPRVTVFPTQRVGIMTGLENGVIPVEYKNPQAGYPRNRKICNLAYGGFR
jgi:hypothetical protein